MSVFNNEIPGYEEIVSYGPSWWTDYREMDAVYRFAGWTLDLMAYFLEKLVLNESPATCDEMTLRAYEKLLRIEYDASATLDERRSTVMAYWSSSIKLSRSEILKIISNYTDQFADVLWDGTTLILYFSSLGAVDAAMPVMRKILARRMPAHIGYGVKADHIQNIGLVAGIASMVLEKRTSSTDTISLEGIDWYGNEGDVIYVDDDNNILII